MVELDFQIQDGYDVDKWTLTLNVSTMENLDGAELDHLFKKLLEVELVKTTNLLQPGYKPIPEDSFCAAERLLKIIKARSEIIKKTKGADQDAFSLHVFEVWSNISKIIRRRILTAEDRNDLLIELKEIDILHTDAMYALKIGSYLPLIDFDMNAALGSILCDIYAHLSGYIDNRLVEIEAVQDDPVKSALLKKEIVHILRVRSFRHRNCCGNFLGIVCLQAAFKVLSNQALLPTIDFMRQRNLQLITIPDENIFAFCTAGLLNDQEKMERFCKSEANVSISTFSDILVIFNNIEGVSELIHDSPQVSLSSDSILCSYIKNSPENIISIATKSAVEVRPIVFELKKIEGLSCWNEFQGFRLQNNSEVFGLYRDRIYNSIASICQKMVKLNLSITYAELMALEKLGCRDEMDSAIFIAATFIFEFLLEVPTDIPCLQQTFEDFVSPSFYWLETYLEDFINKPDPHSACFYLVKSLEMLIPVVSCEAYKQPDYFKDGIKNFKYALEKFAQSSPPKDYAAKHAYILDMGKSYIAKVEGQKTKIKRAPLSLRFPDQRLLESNNYWVLTSFGSSKKLLYKCFDQVSRKLVMIKRLPKSKLQKSPISKGELGYLMTLNHINIVSYIQCFENNDHWFMVMEYCEDRIAPYSDGSLHVTEWDVRNIGRQLLIGLYYLHCNQIVHRDIKPGNILKDGRGFIKIADFGEAQIIPLTDEKEKFDLNSLMGTPAYMAPECLHVAKVHPSADIWSFGCVLVYLITGKHPWQQCSNDFNILYHLGATDAMPTNIDILECNDECKNIIRQCLTRNPEERPTCAQLLSLPFFSEVPETLI